jgi:splicing factor 3B subunit 3
MHLYNLTLQKATAVTCAIHGNFSGTKQQEIVVSRGKIIEILRHDPNTGKVYTLLSEDTFSIVRCLLPVRLTGGNKDYIVVSSDSGRVVILEYNPTKNILEKVID